MISHYKGYLIKFYNSSSKASPHVFSVFKDGEHDITRYNFNSFEEAKEAAFSVINASLRKNL